MENRQLHLKIKIQSLVDESRNIRREANKISGDEKHSLNLHRKMVVRPHTRLNLLAYGTLIHRAYSQMERKCAEKPDFKRIGKIAISFGATEEQVTAWVAEAEAYLSGRQVAA